MAAPQWAQVALEAGEASAAASTIAEVDSEEAGVEADFAVASIAAAAVDEVTLMVLLLALVVAMEGAVAMAAVMTAASVEDVVDGTMPTSNHCHLEVEADIATATAMLAEAETHTTPDRRDRMREVGMMSRGSGGDTRVSFAMCDQRVCGKVPPISF